MARPLKTTLVITIIAALLFGLWYVVWVLPDVPQKAVRAYFESIKEGNFEQAWVYVFPGSEYMRERGGPTLSKDKFIAELQNARDYGTRITKYYILGYFQQYDPIEKLNAEVVRVQLESVVGGTPKTSDAKDYYLKKDKDGIWKIYKGSVPKTK
jgi:hypothetical protein